MFELKYKITDADMKKVNKSIMWQYFVPYLVVALLGIGAGVAAVVLNVRTDVLVLGIILLVLGAILLACTVLLLIAPKNFVLSALVVSDTIERTVKIGNERIDIITEGQENIELSYGEITKLKNKKTYLLAYVGKDIVLVLKDNSISKLSDVYSYLLGKVESADRTQPEDVTTSAEEKKQETEKEIKTEQNLEENAVAEKPAEEEVKEETATEDVKEEAAAEEVKEEPEEKPAEEVKPVEEKKPVKKASSKKKQTAK